MRSDHEVWGDAARVMPFSNADEGYLWMEKWCSNCDNEMDCPVIVVGVAGRTPAEWLRQRDTGPEDQYRCTEFLPVLP
jgi:hypothetical protein